MNRKLIKEIEEIMKICSKCHIKKPTNGFHKDSRSLDGHHSLCKECRKKSNPAKEKKICKKCGKPKPLSDFYKRRNSGYQSYCIDCIKKCVKKSRAEKTKQKIKLKIKTIKSCIRRHNKIVEFYGYNPYPSNIKPEKMEKMVEEIEKMENILKH